MRQLLSIVAFYRQFLFWSLAINLLMGFLGFFMLSAVVSKLFLTVFVWYFMNQTKAKGNFIFYKHQGLSEFKLFAFTFLVDSLITISFLMVFNEFS